MKKTETVNHPSHYGGKDNPYEAIKIIEAWGLGFHLGNALKYILRAGKKSESKHQDLSKAIWYLNRYDVQARYKYTNSMQVPSAFQVDNVCENIKASKALTLAVEGMLLHISHEAIDYKKGKYLDLVIDCINEEYKRC